MRFHIQFTTIALGPADNGRTIVAEYDYDTGRAQVHEPARRTFVVVELETQLKNPHYIARRIVQEMNAARVSTGRASPALDLSDTAPLLSVRIPETIKQTREDSR